MVKLNAAVKFPPLWSRKATPPEPVEAYRDKPEAFPRVWGFKDYDWVEWTIDTNTVMERNITETLGAGATVVLDPEAARRCSTAPIPITNMHALEWLAYYIDPPQWPDGDFGAIKPDLAAAGEDDFREPARGATSTATTSARHGRPDPAAWQESRGRRHRRHCRAADLLPGT